MICRKFVFAVLTAAFAFATAFVGCSNGSDSPVVLTVPSTPTTDNGGGTTTGTDNGGQTTTPAPAKYTITLNANDGSVSPATATQTFTAGTPQNLKTIASLGFNKEGFNFAGWLKTADGTEACYADGAAYTAAADATLYAKWSAIPVYSATPSANARGTVTATPATAIAGTEITLSATPFDGYEFVSYTVTDADSNVVSVTDGKFTMPAKNVTVTATFNAINYSVTVEQPQKGGSVGASADTATVGTEVALLASVGAGYEFVSYAVTAADGSPVPVSNGKFTMPAKNVKVTATFKALNFTVTFNANDGSQSPAMKTQVFETEVPQALKAIVELGFSKNGFTFAGWAKSPDAEQAAYADGAFYKGTLSVTLYAVWSAIPVYSASAEECQNGSVAASPASAIAGTEITLTATPSAGYKLASYTVTGVDGSSVTVLNGKFTMPDKNVKVLANFGAIDYSVSVLSAQHGSVTANKTTAHIDDVITLTTEPSTGYEFESCAVTDADSKPVPVANGTFKMPASDVKVSVTFKAISYRVNVGTVANGTVTANKSSACVGDQITLNATANEGYEFASYTVTDADSNVVTVTNGKFTMPAKSVTVTANFTAINYTVSLGTFENGSVTANKTTATIGTVVTLTISPASGYVLSTLTVTTAGGSTIATSGTGYKRIFTVPAENVNVNATFLVTVSSEYTKVGETTIDGRTYELVTFGLWPQTIKAADITVDESVTQFHGAFTYCKGSDDKWYVKQSEKAYFYNDKYSDGTTIAQSNANSYKWFKVEPIKWRVLTTNYGGNNLLLAESILISKFYDDDWNNYKNSQIRAWLKDDFLQSAFTSEQQAFIPVTSVDNSARSTNPYANASQWNKGENQYACADTRDKVFLLSTQEVTRNAYGFAAYDYISDSNGTATSTRIRQPTDFAKATGGFQRSGVGGAWWLRSPHFDYDNCAQLVAHSGNVNNNRMSVNSFGYGVVPALCVAGSCGGQTVPMAYTVTISGAIANGTVTANPTSASAGTSVTLTVKPNIGYELSSLTVTAADGSTVPASGTENERIFTMPEDDVIVAATFNVARYSVNVGKVSNGSVTASKSSARMGEEITLRATANEGYEFASYTVTDADSNVVTVTNGKFTMPAKSVTVTANFTAINYTVSLGTFENGSVTANKTTATIGTVVTLTISPASGYVLSTLTVTTAGGSTIATSGTGYTWTFKMPAKAVTVTATFKVYDDGSGDYKRLDCVVINGKVYDIVTFGLWPQTIKAANITVDESVTQTRGGLTYCKGSDGKWYVKQLEKASRSGYTYSDGTTVAQSSANSYKWFKVEPIKWRVLKTDNGKKLLLAESILTAGVQYYLNKNSRTIGSATVYANNYKYSTIRAWLNGVYETGDNQEPTYVGKGFLQSAFTSEQEAAISATSVNNSARSTNPDANASQWNSGENQYACAGTTDKIFLLSTQEVTTTAYGFAEGTEYVDSTFRMRISTDFAMATGAFQSTTGCGMWWLRSPRYNYSDSRIVWYNGDVEYDGVTDTLAGVVPALFIAN